MANEELGLRLTAQITEWLANLTKAATAADGLKNTVLELEQSVKRAFAGIEAISRQSGGKMVGAFVGAAREMDKTATAIEGDAKRTAVALGTVGKAADAANKAVAGAAGGIARGTKGIGAAADDAARSTATGLGGIDASVGKIGERIKGSILNIRNALLGLGALRFGQAAVGAASDFEAALGQLAIVANDTGVPIGQLRQQLLDLSKTTPLALGDLTKAYATAVGSLPKGANQAKVAFEALNAAQLAARASGATTEETLRGITAILNTYGDTGITAAQITDKLFATFDQGAATVPELTASIGQVAGIAKSFGISIDEVFGTIAVLTRGGQTASEAITNLRQALISTANGGAMEKVAGQLKALGLSADLFSAQSLRQNGLIGVLGQVEKAGGKPILNKLYTDTQGFLAVSTLLAKGLEQTRDDIERVGQSAGKTDQAVATISQNFDQLAGIAKNKLGAAMIEIGDKIMPTVAKVLAQLGDYAEKNGTAIADGIGKAVAALVSFGEWVVKYGPTVLKWFVAFKAVTFFGGLAADIKAATIALKTFSDGFAASQALGAGLASVGSAAMAPVHKTRVVFDADGSTREVKELVGFAEAGGAKAGAAAGTAMTGGFGAKLKGLGGTLKAAFSSLGTIATGVAVFTIGYDIGTRLMEALGEAIYEGQNRIVMASIDELGREIDARLKAIGAKSVEEAAEIRRRLTAGEVVQTGPGKVSALRDVKGGSAATTAAFNAGLAQIAQEVEKAKTGVAASVARMGEAAKKIEDLKRTLNPGEVAAAEVEFGQFQAVVQTNAGHLGALLEGSKALVAEYTAITAEAAALAKAEANAGKPPKGAGASRAPAPDTFVADMLREFEEGQARLEALRLEGQRLAAQALQDETDAARAAYDAQTDAKLNALEAADVKESQLAEARIGREKGLTPIIDAQIAAMRQVTAVRIEEARAGAEAEIRAAGESADAQALIRANLATEETAIEADLAVRTSEIRAGALTRTAQLEREASKARAEEAVQAHQIAVDAERESSITGRAETLSAGLSGGAQGGQMVQGIVGQLGGGGGLAAGLGGAVTMLPAISAGLGAMGDLFGGDVEGLQKKARAKEKEAADVEKQLASFKGTPEEKQALQDRLTALRKESEELRNAAEAAKGGLETFFEDFFANIDKAIVGLVEGLPQAIDRILTVALPAFLEHIIGALPQIIGGIIILLPRLVWSLAKAIGYVLPIALYDGFVQAGEAMIEFFTSGTVSAIWEGIKGAFSAAGSAFVDAIQAVFKPIIEFFKDAFEGVGDFFGDIGSGIADLGTTLYGGTIGQIFHQGGTVGAGASNPHMAAALAASGAQRFAAGGMVNGLNNIARRRMSQLLSGDDVPILAAPGEGVLTAQGVHAVGGPVGVDAINRGNAPGGAMGAQVMISARLGGDRALAALVARLVSVSVLSPAGNVRAALDQSGIATSVPAYAGLR